MEGILQGLEAVTIHVRDLENARTFYGGVLRLKELQYVAGGTITYAIPGSSTVLLMHIKRPQEQGREPGTVSGLVFSVADVTAVCEAIRASGGSITDEPEKITNTSGTHMRAAFADPDGNEFMIRVRLPS
jgi:predicted enzyme related to lactoylglutathione lyase